MNYSSGRVDRAVRSRKARQAQEALEYEAAAPERRMQENLDFVAWRLGRLSSVTVTPVGGSFVVRSRQFVLAHSAHLFLFTMFGVWLLAMLLLNLVGAFFAVGAAALIWGAVVLLSPSVEVQVTLKPGDDDVDFYERCAMSRTREQFAEQAFGLMRRRNELTETRGPSRLDLFMKKVRPNA